MTTTPPDMPEDEIEKCRRKMMQQARNIIAFCTAIKAHPISETFRRDSIRLLAQEASKALYALDLQLDTLKRVDAIIEGEQQ